MSPARSTLDPLRIGIAASALAAGRFFLAIGAALLALSIFAGGGKLQGLWVVSLLAGGGLEIGGRGIRKGSSKSVLALLAGNGLLIYFGLFYAGSNSGMAWVVYNEPYLGWPLLGMIGLEAVALPFAFPESFQRLSKVLGPTRVTAAAGLGVAMSLVYVGLRFGIFGAWRTDLEARQPESLRAAYIISSSSELDQKIVIASALIPFSQYMAPAFFVGDCSVGGSRLHWIDKNDLNVACWSSLGKFTKKLDAFEDVRVTYAPLGWQNLAASPAGPLADGTGAPSLRK